MNRGFFVPLWQEISGLDPLQEPQLTLAERDDGIRRLLAEVDRLARIEFEHALSSPPGERTVFWDPLQSVCSQLEISRTRLSHYARLLTGLRAHELTDRLKAATLPARMRETLAWLRPNLDKRAETVRARLLEPDFRAAFTQEIIREVKTARAGVYSVEWAVRLGFPNVNRVRRACVVAHGIGIDQLEATLVTTIVQKFLDELEATQPQTETVAAPQEKTPPLTKKTAARASSIKESSPPAAAEPLSPEAQEIIDDAVAYVLGRQRVA